MTSLISELEILDLDSLKQCLISPFNFFKNSLTLSSLFCVVTSQKIKLPLLFRKNPSGIPWDVLFLPITAPGAPIKLYPL